MCLVWAGRDGWATLAPMIDCHSRLFSAGIAGSLRADKFLAAFGVDSAFGIMHLMWTRIPMSATPIPASRIAVSGRPRPSYCPPPENRGFGQPDPA